MKDLIFLCSNITVDGNCSNEIKDACSLEEKLWQNSYDKIAREHIKKQRHYFVNKGLCIRKAMVFPVVMYRCESWIIKKAEHQRIDAFELWRLQKTLESPLDSKKIKPVNPKGK